MPQQLRDRTANPATTNEEELAGAVIDATDGSGPVIVEGATAAEALEEVHRRHGQGARIVNAEKVLRGGVGGFFAKELVQLTVAVDAPTRGPAPAPMADRVVSLAQAEPTHGVGGTNDPHADETFGEMLDRYAPVNGRPDEPNRGLASAFADLAAATDHRESTFGDALRAAIDQPATSVSTVPEPPAIVGDTAGARVIAAMNAVDAQTPTGGASRLLDPRLAEGARALVDAAPGRRIPEKPAVRPEPMSMDRAEARLDAAVRAVAAGTTASTVVRAAEAGTTTGFEPPVRRGPQASSNAVQTIEPAIIAAALAAAAEDRAAASLDAPAHEPVVEVAPRTEPAAELPALSAPTPAPRANTPTRANVQAHSWSADALIRLGLTSKLVNAIVEQRPTDDLSWFIATAQAVTPLCGALPEDPEVIVGGHVRWYANVAGLDVATVDAGVPPFGSFAVVSKATDDTRSWLKRERRNRWLHVVVGGARWRDWLWERPEAISWTSDEDLPHALASASELDLTLGFCIAGDELTRANPVAIAITIRELLDER